MNHAETIYRMVRVQFDYAIKDHIEARAALAHEEEGHQMWTADENNVFGRSPYNVERAKERVQKMEAKRKEVSDLLDYVVLTFIGSKGEDAKPI